MKKYIVNEYAIKVLIVVLLIVCGVVPAWAGHGGPHYAKVTVTAAPTGQGKVYMTTNGDYEPESEDWQNSMTATWNCGDGVNNETDNRTYYVHAQPTSGNHFVKWSSNSNGSDSKSTDAKYAYSTSASSITSGSPTANNIYAIFEANPTYTCTLLTSENGTFKYKYGDSEEVTVASEHSVTTNQNFTFTALPAAGYTIYGWYTKSGSTKTYFDYSSTTISSYALPGNISIGADFVPVGTPIFQIKGSNQTYTDLNAAISACGSATKTIVLINNGTLPAENYTIPANVTLLIPFDEGFTCYTTTPALTTNTFLTPEVYRTLTMAPGATLTVNGAISVSAKLSSRSGYGPNGATSGKYGAIKMLTKGNTKSKITLNTGAKLYGWGYIYGEGAVEALSGSTVYEGFVIMDWRGGNNTLDMYDNRSTYKVFPFNQYYIQNIEVPLTIHKGATETVYSSVYGNGSDNPLSITMVGTSAGLFRLTGTGAKLTKWYDPFYDRQHYELEGAAAINAISFTAFSMTVSSSAFVLPITNNMDITVRSGATVSIAEDICIMPDASVTVEQGATVNIAKNVYVYDIQACTNAGTYTTDRGGYPSAGPGRYAAGAYVRRISYSPSWAALSDREIRRLQNMSSAHFQVNGTLNVNGKLYTTEGGADIFSTADGAAVNLVTAAGTATKTYQVDHENYDAYYYTIPITSALLHNADGSYQATAGNAANTTWTYAHGHWGWCIIWRLEDGTELKRMYQPAQPNATWISSNAPATSKANEGTCSFVFNGWNTVTSTSQQEIEVTADYTKTCAEYYDVLWKSEDGTETYETDANTGKGETTRYNGAAPVKADDKINGFTYTFDGWTTLPNGGGTKYNIGGTPAATDNVTYYAHFAATEVAAIVTANGVVSYYPSIADAFAAANNSDYTPTIQVWRDAQNTPALTYTAKNHCTLDLNGHTVSGTNMPLLTINDEGFTFTVTDRTETKEGKLAGTSGVSQAFVVSLVSGIFRLEAGTVYGQNTGTGVMAGVYAGANREVIMTGGTIQVDANSGTGYGIFAQGKGTINGGTIRVESSAKAAYAVQAQGANGNVTVTDGKFYAAGKTTVTCVLAKGSASLTVNGGYYNINTNLTTYLGAGRHIFNLPSSELPYKYKVGTGGYTVTFQNTDGTVLQSALWENGTMPEYTGDAPAKPGDTGGEFIHSGWTPDLAPVTGDATYTATYVPAPPVASVTINGTTTEYIHFSDAWTAANSATAASTLTLLLDVTVTAKLTYNNSNNKNCTLDLNGHTLTSNTSEISPLNINNANVTFTITDGTVGKSGKLSLNSSSSSTIFGAYAEKGNLLLNAGTIELISGTATTCGVTVHYGTFTMNGGTIHVKTTNGMEGRGIYANSTTTVNGGTVHVEAAGTAYGIRHDGGIMTINDGKFSISGSTNSFMNYKEDADNKLIIKGGYYNIDTRLGTYVSAPYYVFDLTSGAEFEEGYRYKVAEAYTLSWSTDGDALTGDYTSGLIESGATIVAPATPTKAGCIFAGWSPAFTGTMSAANTTYTATWAVASVTISGTTTLYTTFLPAWTAANSATAAVTLTLLRDVTFTAQLAYTNSNNQNCTFNLNGHTLTSNTSEKSPLHINNANVTFTITDGTENKSGKLSLNTSFSTSAIFGTYVQYGTLLLNAGTIELISGTATTCGVTVHYGTFTMNGGTIHVKTTNGMEGRGIYANSTTTVNGGTVHVEAAGDAYGIRHDASTMTINDGKFTISGSTASYMNYKAEADSKLIIKGGYYNINTRLGTYVSAPYHVFDLTSGAEFDEGYHYKVAEGYTVTFKNEDETLQSGLWEKGATPLYSSATPTKAATAQYTYTFDDWSPAIAPVTANATYTAQYSSTVNTYTVTWKNDDGTTLETDENVPYGTTPEYNGATPTKATDAEYAYTFKGWSSAVSAVTGDAVYTATYTTTPVVASVTANASGYTLYYTDFFEAFTVAREATAAVTITLLKDANSAALQYSSANTDCTLDLNGHTLTCTSAQLILNMNKAGSTFTITDKTESKSGQMRIAATHTSEAYGVYVNKGHLKLEAGTIYASMIAPTCAGVRAVSANASFTMDGGKIHVETTNANNGIGVTASNGTTIINDGTIQVEAAANGYGIKRTGGTVTVNGGKFNISATGSAYATNQTSANASVVIRGGYYTTNNQLYPTAPYHVFGLENQSPYLYEVAEGYTLTWTTDGDALTGTYTSGVMKPGATITAPATPTKTGYTFNVWNPAVAAAMPAENTEYTATWTANQYTITFDSNGGSEVASITQDYGSAVTAPADPFRLGYNFTGWTPAVPSTMPVDGAACMAQWEIIPYDISYTLDGGTVSSANPTTYNVETATFTLSNPTKEGYTFLGWTGSNGSTPQTAVSIASGSTGDKNYTANWALNVASVTTNSATTYYTSFADAWTAANSATAAVTLTLLRDVTFTAQLAYTNSNNQNCTFNLNGHTLTSNTSEKSPLHINNANVTFTVTDGTENKLGKILLQSTSSSTIFGAYAERGTLLLNAGTIEVTSSTATTCGVTADQNGIFTMNGGTIHVKTTNGKEGRGVYLAGSVSINGSTVHVDAAGAGYGIRRDGGTVTVNDGKFNVIGSTAYATNQASANASVVIRGGYYTTNSQLYPTAPYHVFGLDNQSPYLYEVAEGYTLTWTTDGDALTGTYTSGVIKPGATITAPATPTKTGYTFRAWSPAVAAAMPAENTEYTATWTANQYTITFDSNGGSEVASITQDYGSAVTAPADPTRLGYNFTGWTPAVPSTMPVDGAACTAQWEIIPYDISYTLDGGTVSSANPTTYNVETATFTLSNPTKEGYTFLGWSGSNGSTPQTAVSIASGSTGDKNYTANWAVNVASVTVNSATTYYTSFADAWTDANSATAAATLTLLQDVTGLSKTTTYSASHDLTLDLNGHTLSGVGTITSLFKISCTGYTFTVTDGSANHDGKLSFSSGSGSTSHCVIVTNGTFVLEAGMIEATSSTTSIGAVQVTGGIFTMNENGAVHAIYTGNVAGKNSRMVHANGANGTININGGTIHLESTSDVIGVVYSNGTVTITGGNFKIEAGGTAAVTNQTGVKNSLNIRGGYYSANTTTYFQPHVKTPYHIFPNSDATYIYRVAEAYTVTFNNDDVTLQSGLWEKGTTPIYSGETPVKAATAQYTYTFDDWSPAIAPVTADVTYTAQFSSMVNTYTVTWKNDDGTTLETDENVPYGNTPEYNGTTPTKATDAGYAYAFSGWSPAVDAVTGDATYTATYTKTPVVASMTINNATTYYTTIGAAWTAVNNATAASTLTLLQNVSITEYLQYNNSNNKNCTLNLNGHTLSSTTAQALLYINHAGVTFTITDLTESKAGTLHLESTGTGNRWCAYVKEGNLQLEAGTVFLRSKANQFNEGVRIDPATSTFTMNGGKIQVVTSNSKPACGIVSRGKAVINGGVIQVEASGIGYGIEARVSGTDIGNVTVNGGKFLVTGSSAACAYKSAANATLKLQGGYYNTNTDLSTYCATNYYVFDLPASADPYKYEVAEGYTVTFKNGTEVLQSSAVKKGDTPHYIGSIPARADDETYSYTFTGWSPAVTSVTADATYIAQFDAVERYYIAPTTQRQDIVDWDLAAGTVTLNMNGYSSNTSEPAGWTVTIGSATKNKDDRATDRTLTFTGLSLTAGEKLLITVHNSDGNVDSRLLYTIPTVYTTSATITAAPTRVLWVKSGTLTVNGDISADSIYVCPGAELKINSGKKLTVGTLVMRTETTVNQYYNPPVLTDNGTLKVTSMYYTRIVRDRSQAFQLGFPFSVNLNGTKYSNGKTATFLKDYSIMYYDAQSRADNGLQSATVRNWKALPSGTTTLQANQGYQLLSTSKFYTEYYFPVTYSKVANGAQVSVTAYSGKAGAGDQGWNYITLPYVHRYTTSVNPENPLLVSELTEDNQTFWQHVVTDLLPVSPFYYQCSESGYLTFTEGNLQKQKPAQESARPLTQWLQLLYGKAESASFDEINIFLHPDKFTVDYETGFDMQKMSLTSTRPLLYSPMACGNLAMVAVPDTMAEQSTIPVTVFAPQKQEMSFSLGSFDYTDRLSHVWLIDKELGTQTDLLFADYEYMAEQGTTAGRFYVRAEFRKIDIPTDLETDGTADDKSELEIEVKGLDINISGLKQGEYVRLYDAVGKLVREQRAGQDGIVRITASTAGTYLLQTDKLFKKVSVVAL